MRNLFARVAVVCLLLAFPLLVVAQSGVASLTGSVTDKSGAVVPNASVTLKNNGTNQTQTATTNAGGQYTFSRVDPGSYTLTVKAPNFSTTSIPNLTVFVGQSASKNVTLELGQVSQVVEVQGEQAAELQTQDASVGGVITGQELRSMPNLGRDATGLVLLQPGAMPTQSGDENSGGQVMGARSDQNTFVLDGGDITNSTDALGSYAGRNNFSGSPHGAVPTPADSVEEFRVVTAGNMGGFSRSAGAEVQMVTRRGTNSWHGNLYDYGIYDETNAMDWHLHHVACPTPGAASCKKPEWRDNRFGGSIGGPIIHDKTFFFINVESRHFLQGNTISKLTPSQGVRNGMIGYLATDGSYKQVPIASMDPLGLGLNSDVAKIWGTMPLPNDTGGDQVNFLPFTASAPLTTNSESATGRLDHQITQNWHFMGSYRYGVEDNTTTNQTLVQANGYKALGARPVWGNFAVLGLTGQLTQHLTNDLHFNFTRLYWKWGDIGAPPQLSNLGGALQILAESSSSAAVPYNIDTQQARQRLWDGKDYNINDNLSWLKGNHLIQVTGRYGWQRMYHQRNDKVTGGLAQPIYYAVGATSGIYSMKGIPTPADMDPSFAGSWDGAYQSMLGMITQATQVFGRNGDLSPAAAGKWITQNDIVNNWLLGFTDAWKIKPSLTLSYGVTWSVELPPYAPAGNSTMEIDTATGKVLSVSDLFNNRIANLGSGKYYNPVIGFMPIKQTGRKYPFNPDYGNVGPRVAIAWNPSFTDSILGTLFGDRKTVIRAGFGRNFDRLNGVDLVMTPALGVGSSDVAACSYPTTTGACQGTKTDPTTAFRIGVNGDSITIPALSTPTAPIIPGTNAPAPLANANQPYASRDWHIDPNRKVGSTDTYTLSIQRELPRNSMIEVGFVGRIAKNLFEKVDLNNVPYMMKMGGQTFAQAFDAMQTAIIAGQTPATQPFFEAALGGPSSPYCSGYTTCTAAVADYENYAFVHRDVTDAFADMEGSWALGDGYLSRYFNEVGTLDTTVSAGTGHYAGLYVTYKKGGKNLSYQFNYTLSKALGTYGWNQDIIDTLADPYNPNRTYGPTLFDRRHVFNGWLNFNLPFGRGQKWLNGGGIADKIVGGWGTSLVTTFGTGVPNQLVNGAWCGGEYGGSIFFYADCATMQATKSGSWNMSRHNNVTVTNGFGKQSATSSYPNAFANPGAIFGGAGTATGNFRYPLFSDKRAGNPSYMYGMGYRTFDISISKATPITEHLNMKFSADLINAFNHPNLSDPSTSISSTTSFGVLTSTQNLPRYIQWGLRFDF